MTSNLAKIQIAVGGFLIVCSVLLLTTILMTGTLQKENIVLHTVTTSLTNTTSSDINLSPYVTLFWPLIFFIAGLVFIMLGLNYIRATKMFMGLLSIFIGLIFIFLKVPFPIIIIPILFILAGIAIIFKIFKEAVNKM